MLAAADVAENTNAPSTITGTAIRVVPQRRNRDLLIVPPPRPARVGSPTPVVRAERDNGSSHQGHSPWRAAHRPVAVTPGAVGSSPRPGTRRLPGPISLESTRVT